MKASDTTPVDAPVIIVRNNKVPPKLGGMVEYVLSERDSPTSPGKYRPAVIVDFDNEGQVILQVFTNGGPDQLANVHRVVGAQHDEIERSNGTWHWPPPRQLVFSPQEVPAAPTTAPEIDDFDVQPDRLEAHIEKKGYAVAQDPFPLPFSKTPSKSPPAGDK